MRPVRTELKFHRNASHNADREVDRKDPGPEAGRLVVSFVVLFDCQRLQYHDERRQPHGELREEVMVSYGEGELQTVDQERAIHRNTSTREYAGQDCTKRTPDANGTDHFSPRAANKAL